ncbi:cation:proton antiporter [Vaginisenegalia massiliensis]|uniref:cation:proton antiporter domain-containing protein n=1 Tax=Vaginisenegalia massiliensis TaxID=2058294 RepID=UPI000F5345DE|nr:cation:proton antiporter [Vaginisenegalia massiliensis]
MLQSLALIFLLGILLAELAARFRLPRLIGMLIAGMLVGPFGLGWLDEHMLAISGEVRKLALVIILIKAGLSLDLDDLKRVGRPALLMSCLPASMEILGYFLLAPVILGMLPVDALVLGAVLGAVSPAVVVPRMVYLMDKGYGKAKGIPQIILAGASMDDIFVIVLFASFLKMALGGRADLFSLIKIPESVVLGVGLGLVAAWLVPQITKRVVAIRGVNQLILILAFALALVALEPLVEQWVAISGLIAVVVMAASLKEKLEPVETQFLSQNFGQIWLAAEILLFVLVGAAVDIRYLSHSGLAVVAIIFLALIFRSVGVMLSLSYTNLTWKERFFCVGAYLPKATVQAAIGSIPLTSGLASGNLILTVAVMAIILTAPLGAIFIDETYAKMLDKA